MLEEQLNVFTILKIKLLNKIQIVKERNTE